MRLRNLRNHLYRRRESRFGKFVIKGTFAKNLRGRGSVVNSKTRFLKIKTQGNVLDLRISIISRRSAMAGH